MMNVNRKNDSMKKILAVIMILVLVTAGVRNAAERQRYDTEERFGFG